MGDNKAEANVTAPPAKKRIDLTRPRYDQSTYWGRVKHFFQTTNPRYVFINRAKLFTARDVVDAYTNGADLPFNEEELWYYKHVYDSAFHPDTGELMFTMGRMSAQVPMNMLITGAMMHFRNTNKQLIFWQYVNQAFNAVVNVTNSNLQGNVSDSFEEEFGKTAGAFLCATTGAVVTALSLNRLAKALPPIFARFVPFGAVAAANCINIPIMRNKEAVNGIPVFTEDEEYIGDSRVAAKTAISQVAFSRVGMATPSMIIPPIIMHRLEKTKPYQRFPALALPTTVALVGLMLTFSTPMCCALFPQNSSISRSSLEPELQEKLDKANSPTKRVFFNKGL